MNIREVICPDCGDGAGVFFGEPDPDQVDEALARHRASFCYTIVNARLLNSARHKHEEALWDRLTRKWGSKHP